MDQNKVIIRNVIRVLGIIAGAVAGIAAFVFRRFADTSPDFFFGCCTLARVGAIVLFVLAVAFVVYDAILKAYPLSIGVIGLVLALVAFVGSFIIAPGSSQKAFADYMVNHMTSLLLDTDAVAEKLATQLSIGSWMVLAGGVFFASYQAGCMKQGK